MAELSSGIICGCFPTVPQFIHYVSNLSVVNKRRSKKQGGDALLLTHNTKHAPARKASSFHCIGSMNLVPPTTSMASRDSTLSSGQSVETFIASIDAGRRGNETRHDIYEREGGSMSPRLGSRQETGNPTNTTAESQGDLETGTTSEEKGHCVTSIVR